MRGTTRMGSSAAIRMGEALPNRMLGMYPRGIRLAVANPLIGLRELDRVQSEESLLGYAEVMWSVLEPGRPLIKGRALEAIAEHLEAVTKGQIRKLLINVPPGFMKSMMVNVFWPSWEWGPKNRPDLRYISASYSQDLTVRDNRRCRQLIESPEYQLNWGDRVQISSDQDAKVKYENTARGWRIATSVGGTTVGERGDRFIIDDPHNIKTAESEKIRESTLQWFTEIVPSRVNDPENSVFVIIMQRVHSRDVSGLVLAKELGYEHLCLEMRKEHDHPHKSRTSLNFKDWREKDGELLWPERFSEKVVNELETQLSSWGGSYAVAGQLQQRPVARGGGMFKKHWWRFFETAASGYHLGRPPLCNTDPATPLPKAFDWTLISVDAAFKKTTTGSRVSIGVIGGVGPKRYVLDNITKHMTFKETCDTIFKKDLRTGMILPCLLQKWPKVDKILIEEKANGSAIIEVLSEMIAGVIPCNPEGGKESRGAAMQPSVESGCYYLPDGAPWLVDFVDEHANFPVGDYDDQVDMMSQMHIYMTTDQDVLRAIQLSNW